MKKILRKLGVLSMVAVLFMPGLASATEKTGALPDSESIETTSTSTLPPEYFMEPEYDDSEDGVIEIDGDAYSGSMVVDGVEYTYSSEVQEDGDTVEINMSDGTSNDVIVYNSETEALTVNGEAIQSPEEEERFEEYIPPTFNSGGLDSGYGIGTFAQQDTGVASSTWKFVGTSYGSWNFVAATTNIVAGALVGFITKNIKYGAAITVGSSVISAFDDDAFKIYYKRLKWQRYYNGWWQYKWTAHFYKKKDYTGHITSVSWTGSKNF